MWRSLFVTSTLLLIDGQKYDPTKIDYCSLKCKIPGQNVACNCSMEVNHEEVLDDIVTFRKIVLDTHNSLRNYLASGNETSPIAGMAANMMALNYDLELEYMARCWARNSFDGISGSCVVGLNGREARDNIADEYEKQPLKNIPTMIKGWYDEITKADSEDPHFIEKYVPKRKIIKFLTLIWWSHTHLGCTRVWNPEIRASTFKFALICYYRSTLNPLLLDGSEFLPLIRGNMVYRRGNFCTRCPYKIKCENSQYPALCGKILPVPTDPPFNFNFSSKNRSVRLKAERFSLLTLTFMLLCYL